VFSEVVKAGFYCLRVFLAQLVQLHSAMIFRALRVETRTVAAGGRASMIGDNRASRSQLTKTRPLLLPGELRSFVRKHGYDLGRRGEWINDVSNGVERRVTIQEFVPDDLPSRSTIG